MVLQLLFSSYRFFINSQQIIVLVLNKKNTPTQRWRMYKFISQICK